MNLPDRELVLGRARYELTVLTPSPLSRKHPSQEEVKKVKNKRDLTRTLDSLPGLVNKAVPVVLGLTPPSANELQYTATTFFQLGEKMAPFYASFADWVDQRTNELRGEGMQIH